MSINSIINNNNNDNDNGVKPMAASQDRPSQPIFEGIALKLRTQTYQYIVPLNLHGTLRSAPEMNNQVRGNVGPCLFHLT